MGHGLGIRAFLDSLPEEVHSFSTCFTDSLVRSRMPGAVGNRFVLGLRAAYFRRTFGVLSAYHPAILAAAGTGLRVYFERDSRAIRRESIPARPTGRRPRGTFLRLRVGESRAVGTGTAELAEKRRTGAMPNGRCLKVARQLLGRPFRSEISAPRSRYEKTPRCERSTPVQVFFGSSTRDDRPGTGLESVFFRCNRPRNSLDWRRFLQTDSQEFKAALAKT